LIFKKNINGEISLLTEATLSYPGNAPKGAVPRRLPFILEAVSKVVIYPRLLHNYIRHISGFYFTVYWKIPVGNGAVPHIMIAPAVPHEKTAVF
jgi:hypothetical protein